MKKPSCFVITDLFLLISGIFSLMLAAYILASGAFSIEIISLLLVISLLFFGFWVFQFIKRLNYLKQFTWYPEYNLMIHWNGYHYFKINDYVDFIIERWKGFYTNSDSIMKNGINWVYFDTNLNNKLPYNTTKKVYGITVIGSRTIFVLYTNQNDKIEDLAFAHEIGHVIRGNAINKWNESDDHAFFEKYGLGRIVPEKE